MHYSNRKSLALAASLAALLAVAGCHHKPKPVPTPPPAPTPQAAAPTASITATPDTINAGDSSTLTWKTTDATDVSIEGLGQVAASGTQTVKPTQTTTYHLIAHGDGGSADATATVTVGAPQQQQPPQETNLDENAFEAAVKPVYYDYDSYEVRPDAQSTIQADANFLNQHPNLKVVIGGYCDERGSTEYNLALGENRANAAKQALVNAGVSPDRLRTVSYGKEKGFCSEHNEACWQQNRRAQFSLDQ
ncbi:MAG TPA: peptidoglycan-associated lipoprotein Pal [Acidobacteriaceae bacterium]|nr:peptidoglycan-associated lipoprotein Pal [Acidobacteriaceae bacterium]